MGSAGHSRALWGVTTLVVIGYSYLLATILPFFSELVSKEDPAHMISMLRVLCALMFTI
jgi:type IV secretory pathway VirJ component